MSRNLLPHLLVVLMASLSGGGSGIAGQEGLTARIVPRLGLVSPANYFYEEFTNFAVDEPDEWTNGSLGRALVVGIGLEFGWEDRGIFLRGGLTRSFDGWLSVTHAIVIPRTLFEPPRTVYTYYDVPAAISTAGLQLVLPTQFEVGGAHPYGLIGGGGKWYHFGDPTEENTVGAILPSNGFTPAFDLGGGISFSILDLTFDAQVKDTINRYWGKTQHDLVFSGGLVWVIR